MTNLDSILKKQRHHSANKGPYSQSCGFSSSYMLMWELDHKEGRASKNWCFWTVVLEKTLESLLDSKEFKPVYLKGNQSWIFIRRTDAKAPILWPPDSKSQLIQKTPMLGRIEGRRRRGQPRARWLDGISDLMGMGLIKLWELVMDRKACHTSVPSVSKSWAWLRDWTELNWGDSERQGGNGMLQSMGVTKSWTQLIDWTTNRC